MKKQRSGMLMLFVTVFLFAGNATHARENPANSHQRNFRLCQTDTIPRWVEMMKDEKVNYHEAVKAFDEFWKNKEKPVEENEIFEGKAGNRKQRVVANPDTRKYAFEYKKFLNWKRAVSPFVQPDGRILDKEEQLRLMEEEKRMRAEATQP
jgi:hypothetical protein